MHKIIVQKTNVQSSIPKRSDEPESFTGHQIKMANASYIIPIERFDPEVKKGDRLLLSLRPDKPSLFVSDTKDQES